MATIAELQTKLTVDNAKFKKGMQDSETAVKGFSTRAKIGFAAVAAIITGGLVMGFRSLINTLGEAEKKASALVDTATRLGAGIPELQRLQYAAQQSGIGVDSLNGALGKMISKLGSAQQGNKSAIDSFAKLGLSVADLSKLGVDEQYIAIADAIKRVGTSAEQATIARDIFGKGGIEQLSLLKDNVRGLVEEFQGLGIELSGEQAKSLESYGDSVSKLDTVWEGFKSQLAAALAGPLKSALEWITNTITNMGGLDNVAKAVANSIVTVAKSVGSFFTDVWTFTQKAIIAVEKLLILLLRVSQVGTLGLSNINLPGGLGGAGDKIQSLKSDISNRESLIPKEPTKIDVNITASEDFVTKIVTSGENKAVVAREAANQIAAAAAAEQ